MDQDLSGDMVKVVQYSIVSVVTSASGGACVLSAPLFGIPPSKDPAKRPLREVNVTAFSDDMTGEDFTSWTMSVHCEDIDRALEILPNQGGIGSPGVQGRKFLRVAFAVIGRFAPADIKYEELQAGAVARLAHTTDQLSGVLEKTIEHTVDREKNAVRTHEVK